MTVRTEKELAEAIKNNENTIEIEGDLKNKTLKIKATGKVAWAIAIGAIAVAIVGITYPVPEPTTQTAAKGFAAFTAVGAAAILGAGTATTAVMIAAAAGGVGVLNKLRSYKIIENTNEKLILKRS